MSLCWANEMSLTHSRQNNIKEAISSQILIPGSLNDLKLLICRKQQTVLRFVMFLLSLSLVLFQLVCLLIDIWMNRLNRRLTLSPILPKHFQWIQMALNNNIERAHNLHLHFWQSEKVQQTARIFFQFSYISIHQFLSHQLATFNLE